MAQQRATVEALMGLLHDLTAEERILLTESDNRTALKEFLATRQSQSGQQDIIAWLTAQLGLRKDAAAYIEAIEASGAKVGDWAQDIMSKPAFVISPEAREVKFARVTLRQLGLKKQSTLTQIIARAKERGLSKCLPEDGPLIRESYCDQPNGEYLWVAMDPIVDSNGDPNVFSIYCDDGERWLHTYYVSPGHAFDLDSEFVFRM